jgi:hypothetical protein
MRECVLVPTFQRQPFLYVCLEAIRKVEPKIEIHVFPDRGTVAENREACEPFGVTIHKVKDHQYHGNSYNMVEALKWAYKAGYDRVFVVEDDCIVDGTFFEWSRNALDNPKEWMGAPFAACGWVYSPSMPQEEGPDLLLNWYLSVCACIPRRSLELIAKHANANYYKNMKKYCDKTFPHDPTVGTLHFEQDGLIVKVANEVGQRCTWPRTARGKHIGWVGYHMTSGKMPQGELKKQVLVVKMALENPDLMQSLMAGNLIPETVECRDCSKLLVSVDNEAALVCAPCFHLKHPDAPRAASGYYCVKP